MTNKLTVNLKQWLLDPGGPRDWQIPKRGQLKLRAVICFDDSTPSTAKPTKRNAARGTKT